VVFSCSLQETLVIVDLLRFNGERFGG
jgi:hypothetical protein